MATTPAEAQQQLADIIQASMTAAIQPLVEQGEKNTEVIQSQAKKTSSSNKKNNNKQAGLLKSIVQNISLPLPGGARLFGLSSFMDKIGQTTEQFERGRAAQKKWTEMSQADKDAMDPEDRKALKKKSDEAMSSGTHKMRTLTAGVTAAGTAIVLMTEGLRALGKSLGGVSEGQAASQLFGAIGQTFQAAIKGEWLNPQAVLQLQGAVGQEFGQLLTSEAAATMTKVATDFGITTNQMAKLERTFQATAMDSRTALDSFAQVGILGQTAATELAANAGAVARAGDNFNEFIRDGIKNAKQLGLEFSKMESTLTGFTMDFEGTVTGFSELRAVIPGMATDFGQLLTTAMTGTTDEYIDQIRSSLLGAGISDASQMNRQQAALLEKATGFSADQIDRILKGENINADINEDLNKKRNWLLVAQLGLLGGILGATVAGLQAAWKTAAMIGGMALAGATAGLILSGGKVAVGKAKNTLGDAYITKEGKTMPFSDDDNVLLTKRGLTTPQEPARSPDAPPQDDSAMLTALGRIESALSRRQTIDLRGGQAFVERNMKNSHEGQVRMGVA